MTTTYNLSNIGTYKLKAYTTVVGDGSVLNDTTNLATAKFTADKEYYAMPHYKGLPSQGSGNATSTNVYFNYNGISYGPNNIKSSNILEFGSELKLEWQSIFINTFVSP